MSLIIKGVDMPKSGESMTYSSKEIIEIPRPHGRLIDADRLLEEMSNAVKKYKNWVNFFAIVEEAPTIIEAEVE